MSKRALCRPFCIAALVAAALSFPAVCAAPPSTSEDITLVDLDGTKTVFTLDDILKCPQETEEECICVGKVKGYIGIIDYTGARLSGLLEKATAAQKAGEYRKENMYVVFRGTDGYQVIASWTELTDTPDGRRALIAVDKNKERLPASEGEFRLVLPGDKYVARSVKCLSSIEIRCADGVVEKKKE